MVVESNAVFMDCSSEYECLFDSVPDKISVLPGQRVSPDDQCKEFYGQNSSSCDVSLLNTHYVKFPVRYMHTYVH